MNLSEVNEILNASVITGETSDALSAVAIHTACGSDLMSDVLAFVKEQGLLLTGLINPQVIRTAEMMDICAICFVRGKKPDDAVIALAKERGMVLLATDYPLFAACGRLYAAGLGGGEEV
jgi:predicted transcriptional regulator